MHFQVAATTPYLNAAQCNVASQSRLILENAVGTTNGTGLTAAGMASGAPIFAGPGSGVPGIANLSGFIDSNVSSSDPDSMESSDPRPCCSDAPYNHHGHHHYHNLHPYHGRNSKIVKWLNRRVDCIIGELGPETVEIYPRPPKRRKHC